MKLKNKTYDFWKSVAMIYLPAISTCIATIFKIWNLSYGVEITATIMAIDTLLGAILGVSTKNYRKED